ncbi:MAG: MATE family efflux transporter [Bacillota bacterium]|nr:MATE family efflux transporter [Bacillota bacterium]
MKKIDILHGSIWDKVLAFALPLAATSVLQQLFNSADVAVVGQFSGSKALAAVGSTSPITSLFITIFVGLSIGANVVISRFLGAQNDKQVKKAVHTSLVLSVISGIIIALIGELIAKWLLVVMSTPAEVLDQALVFLRITFIGMIFLTIYNFESAVLRASGDTKRPLYCLLISGVINVSLGLFFVVICKLDVAGVALATLIADATSALLLLIILIKEKGALKVSFKDLQIDPRITKDILFTGIPAAIQGMLFNIANIIIQSGINSLGADVVAASTVGLNFEIYIYYLITGFAQASITFNSQNYGAKNYKRCIQSTRWCMGLGFIFTMLLSGIFILFSHTFAGIFTSDQAIIELATIRMRYILAFEFLNMTIEIMSGSLRGLGNPMISTILCVIFVCGVRLFYMFVIFPHYNTFNMLLIIYPISWATASASIVSAYFVVKKKKLLV